jgi:RNA-directed DNA polymerase
MSHSNKDKRAFAENEEGRPLIKENTHQPNTYPTQSGESVSQGLAGVRKAARNNKEMRFTALLHHLTVELLRESFYSLKRKAAPGVDGVTWHEYESGLEDRLIDLHGRVHRGAYRALPSRRVYIEKEDGRQRPLGVAALEDKIVQYAVVTKQHERPARAAPIEHLQFDVAVSRYEMYGMRRLVFIGRRILCLLLIV